MYRFANIEVLFWAAGSRKSGMAFTVNAPPHHSQAAYATCNNQLPVKPNASVRCKRSGS
jgi:hypothetical protein